MKVVANHAICQGHARCAEICPEVFTTDERLGKVVVRLDHLPHALEERARLAVRNCPEGALRLGNDPGSAS
jgi:ferredoxin